MLIKMFPMFELQSRSVDDPQHHNGLWVEHTLASCKVFVRPEESSSLWEISCLALLKVTLHDPHHEAVPERRCMCSFPREKPGWRSSSYMTSRPSFYFYVLSQFAQVPAAESWASLPCGEKQVQLFTSITSKSVCIGGAPDCLDRHPDAACSHPAAASYDMLRCKANCKKWEKVRSNWVYNLETDVGEANTLKQGWRDKGPVKGFGETPKSKCPPWVFWPISRQGHKPPWEPLNLAKWNHTFVWVVALNESPAFRFWRACVKIYTSSEFVKNKFKRCKT